MHDGIFIIHLLLYIILARPLWCLSIFFDQARIGPKRAGNGRICPKAGFFLGGQIRWMLFLLLLLLQRTKVSASRMLLFELRIFER